MRFLTRSILITAGICLLPAIAAAAQASTPGATVAAPKFPTPFISAILGLSLTAVAVIGARVTQRTSGIMMYLILGCVVVTGVLVAASYRIHRNFDRAVQDQSTHAQAAAAR